MNRTPPPSLLRCVKRSSRLGRLWLPLLLVLQRIVLGHASGPLDAARQAVALHGGLGGLMTGWQANLLKDVPFAVIKLGLFEGCVALYEHFATARSGHGGGSKSKSVASSSSSQLFHHQHHQQTQAQCQARVEAGPGARTACGVISGAATAVLTHPLDVINTRIKGGAAGYYGRGGGLGVLLRAASDVVAREGPRALFLPGLAPRALYLGAGSGVFWGAYSHTRAVLGLDAHGAASGTGGR